MRSPLEHPFRRASLLFHGGIELLRCNPAATPPPVFARDLEAIAI